MYCNNCGYKNSTDAKFCQKCGSKIQSTAKEHHTTQLHNEINKTVSGNKETVDSGNKIKPGLTGWLALVGLGLILAPFITGYALLGYFPLFNQSFSNYPGLYQSIQFEFVVLLAFFLLNIYLLYLFFKKSAKFPKFYIIYLISYAIYTIIDNSLVTSIVSQYPSLHNTFASAISDGAKDMDRAIFGAIIWVWYTLKSKRVKVTFTNK